MCAGAGSRLQKHIALIACLRFDITIFIEARFSHPGTLGKYRLGVMCDADTVPD